MPGGDCDPSPPRIHGLPCVRDRAHAPHPPGVRPPDARHARRGAVRRPGLAVRGQVGRLPRRGGGRGRHGQDLDPRSAGRGGLLRRLPRHARVDRGPGCGRRRRGDLTRRRRRARLRAAPGPHQAPRPARAVALRVRGVRPPPPRRPVPARRAARGATAALAEVLRPDPRVRLSEHVEETGLAFFEAAQARGLEGIMAKRRSSPYVPGGRTMAWQKIKIRPEQELVVGGWTPGAGKAFGLGALLVGVYEDGALRYAGKVGAFMGTSRASSRRRSSRSRPTPRRSIHRPRPLLPGPRHGLRRSSSSVPSSPAGPATGRFARRLQGHRPRKGPVGRQARGASPLTRVSR